MKSSSSIYSKRKWRKAVDTSVKYGGVMDGLLFGEKLGPMPFTTVVNTLKTRVKNKNFNIEILQVIAEHNKDTARVIAGY